MRQQKYKNPAESHKRRNESLPYCGRMIRVFSLLFCLTLSIYSVDLCDITVKENPLDFTNSLGIQKNYNVENGGTNNILLPAQLIISRNVYSQEARVLGVVEEFNPIAYSLYAKPFFTSLVVNRLDGGCLHFLAGFNFQIRAIDFLSSTTVDWLLSFHNQMPGNRMNRTFGKRLSYDTTTYLKAC